MKISNPLNRGGRNTSDSRLAQQMVDAKAEGVRKRAQAGGAPGGKRRRSDAGKPRPKSRTRPVEATPAAVNALFRAGMSYRAIAERLGIIPGAGPQPEGRTRQGGNVPVSARAA